MSKRVIITVVIAAALGLAGSYLFSGLGFHPVPDDGDQPGDPDSPPERIICMSPSVTELVFALGQGERVVGVSQHVVHPPGAMDKPRCGGFVNPNFERIMALKPDLVVTQGLAKEVRRFADEQGLRCLTLEITDLNSIYSVIDELGRTLKCPQEADRLTRRIKTGLEAVKTQAEDHPTASTFLVIGREPGSLRNLHTIGPGSYLADVLQIAGGQNLFSDLDKQYGTVNKEALAERQPEAIVELHGEGMMSAAKRRQVRQTWGQMAALPAVRNGRICVITETYALIPGPRIVKLARDLARCIHPEEINTQ